MPKTIHTPEPPESFQITFPSSRIAEFGRVDPESGWVKFRCHLAPKNIEPLFNHFGWQVPGEKVSLDKLDGKLAGGHFIMTAKPDEEQRLKLKSKDGRVDTDMEINIEYLTIDGFECHRLELEGRKKKGFRRELRFKAKFNCEDGAANLEAYMMRTDNARGSLKVTYVKEPEQTNLVPDGVTASEDQRQGALDIQ
jgi:hypothetical protein